MKAPRRQTAMLAEHRIPVTASVGVALFDGLTNIGYAQGFHIGMPRPIAETFAHVAGVGSSALP